MGYVATTNRGSLRMIDNRIFKIFKLTTFIICAVTTFLVLGAGAAVANTPNDKRVAELTNWAELSSRSQSLIPLNWKYYTAADVCGALTKLASCQWHRDRWELLAKKTKLKSFEKAIDLSSFAGACPVRPSDLPKIKPTIYEFGSCAPSMDLAQNIPREKKRYDSHNRVISDGGYEREQPQVRKHINKGPAYSRTPQKPNSKWVGGVEPPPDTLEACVRYGADVASALIAGTQPLTLKQAVRFIPTTPVELEGRVVSCATYTCKVELRETRGSFIQRQMGVVSEQLGSQLYQVGQQIGYAAGKKRREQQALASGKKATDRCLDKAGYRVRH